MVKVRIGQAKPHLSHRDKKGHNSAPFKLRTDKEEMYLKRSGNTEYDSTLFQIRTGRLVNTQTIKSDPVCTSHKKKQKDFGRVSKHYTTIRAAAYVKMEIPVLV